MIIRAVLVWVGLLVVAILNGGFREAVLAPRLGRSLAHGVSTVMLSLFIVALGWVTTPWVGPKSLQDAWMIGGAWVVLTLAFEFLILTACRTSEVLGARWSEIMQLTINLEHVGDILEGIIRDLRDKINFSPSQGKYKIYIIDEVHMLSAQAFNALLKTLEEPPPHVKFIFATTEAQKVLPTIVSRCQRFDASRQTRCPREARRTHRPGTASEPRDRPTWRG